MPGLAVQFYTKAIQPRGGARSRRALTLLELMLALGITAIVGLAIAGMMGAVTTGVGSRRDVRSVMIMANAAASRLSAYIAPSRCALAAGDGNLVLWFNDSRQSDTVHATELRWLMFDAQAGTIAVHFVRFPGNWTQAARDLEDKEYALSSDWETVLKTYQASGWTASRTLVDNIAAASISTDQQSVLNSRMVSYVLTFDTEVEDPSMTIACTMAQHAVPSS